MQRLFTLGLALILSASVTAATKEEQVKKLIKDLESGTSKQKVAAADEIAKFGELKASLVTGAVKPLLKALKACDADVRVAAAHALGRIDAGEEAVPALTEILKKDKEDRKVILASVRSLGVMGGEAKEAVPVLKKMHDDAKKDVMLDKEAMKDKEKKAKSDAAREMERATGDAMRSINQAWGK